MPSPGSEPEAVSSDAGEGRPTLSPGVLSSVKIIFIQTVYTICPSNWQEEATSPAGDLGAGSILQYRWTSAVLCPSYHSCGLSRETFFLSLQSPLSGLSKPVRLGVSSFHSSSSYQSPP